MRLLLDECVPRPLKQDFVGHEVSHVRGLDWSGRRNGEILDLMVKAGFQGFITVDRNLEFQQTTRAGGWGAWGWPAKTTRPRTFTGIGRLDAARIRESPF